MSHWINLPLDKVDEAFLAELKKQHAAGTRVELRVVDPGEPLRLSDARFWQVIGQLDLDQETDEQILQPAVDELAGGEVVEIFLFEDLLAEKLQALDTPQHALSVYPETDQISVDGFLYVRAGVMALGQEHFETVLKDPSAIDADWDFEPLLSLAEKAYFKKTNKAFAYHSHISYETFSNKNAWSK